MKTHGPTTITPSCKFSSPSCRTNTSLSFARLLLLLLVTSSSAFLSHTRPPTTTQLSFSQRRIAHSKRESLRWVIQSLQRYPKPLDPNLLTALELLEHAHTQRQVSDAGRLLEIAVVPDSVDIKERLIKAASIAGLLGTAQKLMEGLLQQKHFPSSIAYVAYLQGLRQGGKFQTIETILDQLQIVAAINSDQISVLALNTYLAALLDLQGSRLEEARTALRNSQSRWNIPPDATSFATVMNSSNRLIVEQLWQELLVLGIEPTLYCYHARLKVATDEEALAIFDEIKSNQEPDRYTIDFVILPLIRLGKTQEVHHILQKFMRQGQGKDAAAAFAAFLTKLCNAGEVKSAQLLFDEFLKTGASNRHYNIMLSGYRKVFDKEREEGIRGKAIMLYKKMITAGLRPDEYTLTTMTGFALDHKELTELMRVGILECNIEVTPEVLRAAITAFGNVKDPSSALWMFDMFPDGDVRTWNALMGTFSKSGQVEKMIKAGSSQAALILEHDLQIVGLGNGFVSESNRAFSLTSYVDSLPSPVAARVLLDLMAGQIAVRGIGMRVPRPNSQTYALAAKALQFGQCNATLAMALFKNAYSSGVTMDGRFVNGVFRLFGEDIDGALSAWKSQIRRACITDVRALESTLVASYHGLLYVSGRAMRPDLALRIVYAMYKEKVVPDETALNCYLSGKRRRLELAPLNVGFGNKKADNEVIRFSAQFESLLSVECLKYNTKDKRRHGEKRVRIIL